MFVSNVDNSLRNLSGLGASTLIVSNLNVNRISVRGNALGLRADNTSDASRGRRRLAKKEG